MKNILKLSQVFLVAWLLNLLWENVHVLLYEQHLGIFFAQMDPLEKFVVLFRASIFDATFITAAVLVGLLFASLFKKKNREKFTTWFVVSVGVIFAVWLEIHALNTGRWMYNELMPIIPILNVGLSPTVQLGLTGYLAYKATWWA